MTWQDLNNCDIVSLEVPVTLAVYHCDTFTRRSRPHDSHWVFRDSTEMSACSCYYLTFSHSMLQLVCTFGFGCLNQRVDKFRTLVLCQHTHGLVDFSLILGCFLEANSRFSCETDVRQQSKHLWNCRSVIWAQKHIKSMLSTYSVDSEHRHTCFFLGPILNVEWNFPDDGQAVT